MSFWDLKFVIWDLCVMVGPLKVWRFEVQNLNLFLDSTSLQPARGFDDVCMFGKILTLFMYIRKIIFEEIFFFNLLVLKVIVKIFKLIIKIL